MKLDHVVILVPDLTAAVADYTELGFRVMPGGAHADRLTENALIPFADGTYLELIAFNDPGTPQLHRWWRFIASGGGLIDYALACTNLQQEVATLANKQLIYDGPHPGGRQRPDGTELVWQGAFAPDGSGLPFLIEDVTDRSLRVPDGAAKQHPNGVRGIGRVVVGVSDVDVTAERYAALLSEWLPKVATDSTLESRVAQVPITPTQVVLAQPLARDLPLAVQVASRGPGIYALWLETDGAGATLGWLNPQRTHGARLQLVRSEELSHAA